MSLLASLAIVLQATTAQPAAVHPAHGPQSAGAPHPAVVRVITPESDGVAYGSGTLVATTGQHGLIVTNCHVVRDAVGQITVVFPDGFRSAARVIAIDANWDLAALAIWRPKVEPIRLADRGPSPGDPLSIAGYGGGRYRTITGRCTQYVAPGSDQPFEMVELSVAARQGDSGGPIFNHRGELAGVLFGSAQNCTTGSYSGRVRWFLESVTDQFRQAPDPSLLVGQPVDKSPTRTPAQTAMPIDASDQEPWGPVPAVSSERPGETFSVTAAIAARGPTVDERPGPITTSKRSLDGRTTPTHDPHPDSPVASKNIDPAAGHVPNRFDQIKTILAVIGAVAILFHGLRLLSVAQKS